MSSTVVVRAPPAEGHLDRKNDDGSVQAMVRRHVTQQMAATMPPPAPAAPPPMQVIIRNSASTVSEHTVAPEPPAPPMRPPINSWEAARLFLLELWDSPVNRLFFLGSLGAICYLYREGQSHRWRMAEMQRRIDHNPLLSLVQRFFGSPAPR